MEDIIFGRGPVTEALKADRAIDKLLIKSGPYAKSLVPVIDMAKKKGIVIQQADPARLDKMAEGGNHQGVIAMVSAYEYVSVKDILNKARDKGESPFVIICDKITDPHNLGAIIRTANCVGATGVIIPKRNSVGVNSVVMKTSVGAAEYTPVAKVTNIAATIEELQKEGLWITAADMDGQSMYDIDFKGAIGIVVGSEGSGISRLVREKCDFIASIPMKGEINSLNASVAASVLMYEALRQRRNIL
ncbi:MAG: 23S rRNA (guanosine(2251)-2'-O)-methyltransferase RlmB [Candidatus Ornithomonoglobus sp.]